MIAAIRREFARLLAAIVTDDPAPELSQLDRWDRGER